MLTDLRHALPALRADRRFTLTLTATLATGIAASGATRTSPVDVMRSE